MVDLFVWLVAFSFPLKKMFWPFELRRIIRIKVISIPGENKKHPPSSFSHLQWFSSARHAIHPKSGFASPIPDPPITWCAFQSPPNYDYSCLYSGLPSLRSAHPYRFPSSAKTDRRSLRFIFAALRQYPSSCVSAVSAAASPHCLRRSLTCAGLPLSLPKGTRELAACSRVLEWEPGPRMMILKGAGWCLGAARALLSLGCRAKG